MPFVIISQPLKSYDGISYVGIDNVAAAQEAVNHLARLGRKRIGTITGKLHNREGQDRLRGYEQGIKLAGLPYTDNLVAEGYFSRQSGYAGMIKLLEQGVDALFAASDVMAVGALEAIQEAGRRVPEDIAVVGFDDLPLATQVRPALTTVRQPIAKKASIATSTLIGLIEGRMQAPVQVLLPTQLVIRDSCGAKQKG
jgi:LacI family transcriptional regulator